MKPIYKSLTLAAMTLQVAVSLQAQVTDGTDTSQIDVPAEVLDSLRVELLAPNISGARDLIESGECTVSDNTLSIELQTSDWLKGGVYRLQVIATFGTQTEVIYALDVTVPRYDALASDPQEYEDTVTVVSTVGGGGGAGGADANVYAKDANGNAHITKSLNVSGSVQEGNPYGSDIYELNVVVLDAEQKAEVEAATGTPYDYCETNDNFPNGVNVTIYSDEECTQKVGSTAKTEYAETPMDGDFFNLQEGESLSAGTYYARSERGTLGTNSHAEGNSTTASGTASHAEGDTTTASGYVAHAEGNSTTSSGDNSHAEGNGTTASGYVAHAEGNSTIASGDNSHAEGNGTTASGYVAHAEGNGTTASGTYSHAEGNSTIASGTNSHAEGSYTIAAQDNQHVCGRFNVEDTNGEYALIVGNGQANDPIYRSNAFAIDWNGNLVLFNNGTPVVLTPAKLAQLIA